MRIEYVTVLFSCALSAQMRQNEYPIAFGIISFAANSPSYITSLLLR